MGRDDFLWRLGVCLLLTLLVFLVFTERSYATDPPEIDATSDGGFAEDDFSSNAPEVTSDDEAAPPDTDDPLPDSEAPLEDGEGGDDVQADPAKGDKPPSDYERYTVFDTETSDYYDGLARLADDVSHIRQSLYILLNIYVPLMVAVYIVAKFCKWFYSTFCVL